MIFSVWPFSELERPRNLAYLILLTFGGAGYGCFFLVLSDREAVVYLPQPGADFVPLPATSRLSKRVLPKTSR